MSGTTGVTGHPTSRRRWWAPLLVVAILLLVAMPRLINTLVTYWWFGELGYSGVYTTKQLDERVS